jgi:hypothetical protein
MFYILKTKIPVASSDYSKSISQPEPLKVQIYLYQFVTSFKWAYRKLWRTLIRMREITNAYIILVGKPEEKRPP